MNRELMLYRRCTQEGSVGKKLGRIGCLLRGVLLILLSVIGPSIAVAQLTLRVAQPPRFSSKWTA